jgi:GT2 family glycosyltransferase
LKEHRLDPLISAVIVTYNAAPALLTRCLDSLRAQTYPRLEILVVDNGSRPESLHGLCSTSRDLRLVRLDRNIGFAGGVNRGIEAAGGDFVLVSNFDVELEADCVRRLAAMIATDERLAGVAPKTVFMHDRHLIDNVGTRIDGRAVGYHVGVGQLDIGQYDVSEPVFGACFATALLRRSAFAPDAVGPLDERYFMYYEDVDWCYRANLLGWRFRTAPTAVVAHVHSASVRHLDYAFKHYLLERNVLRTIVKNVETARMARLLVRRSLAHLVRAAGRRPYWRGGLRALADFARDIRCDWRARSMLQRRRCVRDEALVALSPDETIHFDPVRLEPRYTLDALESMYRRRYRVTGDARAAEIAASLRACRGAGASPRATELLRDEPPFVLEFVARVGS